MSDETTPTRQTHHIRAGSPYRRRQRFFAMCPTSFQKRFKTLRTHSDSTATRGNSMRFLKERMDSFFCPASDWDCRGLKAGLRKVRNCA
jgi:hypothetical protein